MLQTQAFGDKAKEYATQQLLNKKVTIKCLSRDQYGRLLARVTYTNNLFFKKDISEELLKQGLAVVYRQGIYNIHLLYVYMYITLLMYAYLSYTYYAL